MIDAHFGSLTGERRDAGSLVAAGHDHDPVVIAGVENGLLDRVVLALLGELRLSARRCLALAFDQTLAGWLGRRVTPFVCALRKALSSTASELLAVGAEADDADLAGAFAGDGRLQRARVGTSPPAAGCTDVSGAGSGQ